MFRILLCFFPSKGSPSSMWSDIHFSFSNSASPRSNQIPRQAEHLSTVTPPLSVLSVCSVIPVWHLGQSIESIESIEFFLNVYFQFDIMHISADFAK